MKNNLIKLYEYNAWRYHKMFTAIDNKADSGQFIVKDYKLFFRNVIGTLKHNLCADLIWYGRINQINALSLPFEQPTQQFDLAKLIQLWKSDDSDVFNQVDITYDQLKIMLFSMNQKYQQQIKQYDDEQLMKVFNYKDSKDQECKQEVCTVLYHLINHHTHHIGQVSAAFTQEYGHDGYFSIDLIYFNQRIIV